MPPEPQATSDFIHDVMIEKKKVRSGFMACLGLETERSYSGAIKNDTVCKKRPLCKKNDPSTKNLPIKALYF